MNKSKQILQSEGQNNKKKKKVYKENRLSPKVLIFIGTFFVVVIASIIGYDILHKEVIVSVGEKNFYLKDMMYQIYTSETSNESMSQVYKSFYDQLGQDFDYWTQENNGVTVQQEASSETLSNVIYYEVMYQEALKKGLSLSAEEKATVQTTIDSLLKDMPKKRKKLTGFTKANLTPIVEQKTLVDRYYQELIDSYDVDDEAIKAGIDFEEYRQYDIEYVVRSIQMDDNGDPVTMTDEDKTKVKTYLTTILNKAKDGEALDKILSEEDISKNYSYSTANFIKNNEDNSLDEAIMKAAEKLKNGEVADQIVETEQGYYVIKMVDNASKVAYDEAVKKAISDAELTIFEKDYTEMKALYKISINEKEWAKVEMGTVTLVKGEALTTATTAPTATTDPSATTDPTATTDPNATAAPSATAEATAEPSTTN